MKRKKVILALALTTVLAAGQTAVTVMAHGHRGGCHGPRSETYSLCEVEGCNTTGVHEHDGVYYCGHFIGDGHDYHEVCCMEGCTETAEHEHDGAICLPHNSNDGHSYHTCGHSSRRRHH